jgi:hypothetical protein
LIIIRVSVFRPENRCGGGKAQSLKKGKAGDLKEYFGKSS